MSTLLSPACRASKSSLERLYRARQSHPNPLALTRPKSVIYPQTDPRQTHLSYLQCFQYVSLEKGAFSSKKIVACVLAVPVGGRESAEPHAVPADRQRTPLCNNCTKPVNPLGSIVVFLGRAKNAKNIHTPKAGTLHGINNLSQNKGARPKAGMSFRINKSGATSKARKWSFSVGICPKVDKKLKVEIRRAERPMELET